MLTISVTDLIPSSFTYLKDYNFFFRLLLITFSFILGIFLSYYISLKVEKEYSNSLKKIEIISMLAIILHNIPEDCIYYVSQLKCNIDLKLKTTKIKYVIILVVYLDFISIILILLSLSF